MIAYYAKLAWLSVSRAPVISALMVITIAIGIGVYMTTFSLYYMMSSNPVADKDDRLFYVQLDSWDPARPNTWLANHLPGQLTYRDATALLRSEMPSRQTAMFRYGMAVTPPRAKDQQRIVPPFVARIRVTTADFFPMFDVPFLYGGPWSSNAEAAASFVTVIDRTTNDKVFNGRNSVGETLEMDGQTYTVVGVLDRWQLPIKVYDLNNSAFADPEQIYIPFSLTEPLQLDTWGNRDCWKDEDINTYSNFLLSECVWLQYWVELPNAEIRKQYERFIESFIREQKSQGRFERPLAYALNRPSLWLQLNRVVNQDNSVLVWLSMAFLLVCIVNAIALMLAKFIRKAPEVGVRRALGASRMAVFTQHLIESGLIGLLGGLIGIGLSLLGLMALRVVFSGTLDRVAQMDSAMMLFAVFLAIVSALLAGFYPAWRVAETNPALYLKTQ